MFERRQDILRSMCSGPPPSHSILQLSPISAKPQGAAREQWPPWTQGSRAHPSPTYLRAGSRTHIPRGARGGTGVGGGSEVPLCLGGNVPTGTTRLRWSISAKRDFLCRHFPSVIIRRSNYPLILVIWKQHGGNISSCDRAYGNVSFGSSMLYLATCPQLWKHRCSCSLAVKEKTKPSTTIWSTFFFLATSFVSE